jgi:hypothetical protein
VLPPTEVQNCNLYIQACNSNVKKGKKTLGWKMYLEAKGTSDEFKNVMKIPQVKCAYLSN